MTIYIALSKARSLCGQTLGVLRRTEPLANTAFPRLYLHDIEKKKKRENNYFFLRVEFNYCCDLVLLFYFAD